ncbi:hypothetical protein BN8_02647 [Fibrisoma limi BUZ 3]|uniref:DUF3127 domain-containing protein n=1 Tax=Fibrisoma limi BUZ 3 TaxID=1185876 RepID=I2GI19_9BACT|nr:DUF3127 domain-containing protein [Fibrisoma limi]CCH53544.1 hypothetical protein BN8_02647 [Fibrisoma limi BUZ 3]
MALELTGKLIKVLPEVTGQGKNGAWNKQEFVIETNDPQFPKKVCMTAWGDKANDLKQFAQGDTLKATFSLESREYNERWYTEARAYRIELVEGDAIRPDSAPVGRTEQPRQQPRTASQSQPAGVPFNTSFDDESNDLPF